MDTISRYLINSTTILAIAFGFFYVYAKYKLSYWSRRGVKTPPTHLIFGNFKDVIMLKKAPADLMCEMYESADPDDPYIGFYIFHQPMLLLRNHELIKETMIKHYNVFPNRRFGSVTNADFLGFRNLLAITSQQTWKFLKTKLTPSLTGQKLKIMIPLITKCIEPMLKYIDGLPENEDNCKEIKDVREISTRYVSNVLASVTYGIEVNAFEEESSGFFEAGINLFRGSMRAMVLMIYFFVPMLSPLIEPFTKRGSKYFRKHFDESVKYREETRSKRGDLVDYMIMLKNGKQHPDFKFEGNNLAAQASSFYIAGFEASGTLAAWVINEITLKPEYQNALYKEIKKYQLDKEITMESINETPFLDCIINETLRLHPPIPVIDRIAEADFEIKETGLVIEKSVSIYVSVNAVTKDPKYFNDSCEFLPLREKTENKKFYESLGFGIGPRTCIGQRLAIIIMKVMIITLVSNYVFTYEKRNVENVKKKKGVQFIQYMDENFLLKFKKRELSEQVL
ncbi:PREDICTED: cytochrome P450 6k1-like [Dinoponera quadriceps]|uniref:Cytochrome P450 6k1-like n=1 Tax=Dinoponera quadriceps TaxID=609295 RepID=A0A6P3WSK0_DINQU|nr:PREDICTED: cytochrome P450 6k1-like [Dinoponera quadriceps]